LHFKKKLLPLSPKFWWRFSHSRTTLKRESGANPEQTRCCKLQQKPLRNTQATAPKGAGRMPQKEEVSQKTCQNNTRLKLSRNEA
jgi:hypothetical protein